jgi:hypothetical protein
VCGRFGFVRGKFFSLRLLCSLHFVLAAISISLLVSVSIGQLQSGALLVVLAVLRDGWIVGRAGWD